MGKENCFILVLIYVDQTHLFDSLNSFGNKSTNLFLSQGETEEVMCEILAFEADRRAFIITINSFGTELTKDDREKLYPTCGKLYPDGLKALARADDYEQVKSVAEYYSVSFLLEGYFILFLNAIS